MTVKRGLLKVQMRDDWKQRRKELRNKVTTRNKEVGQRSTRKEELAGTSTKVVNTEQPVGSRDAGRPRTRWLVREDRMGYLA
jgi:hypothetical protein